MSMTLKDAQINARRMDTITVAGSTTEQILEQVELAMFEGRGITIDYAGTNKDQFETVSQAVQELCEELWRKGRRISAAIPEEPASLAQQLRNAVENPVMGVVSVRPEKLIEAAARIEQLERELVEALAAHKLELDLRIKSQAKLAAEKALADRLQKEWRSWVGVEEHHLTQTHEIELDATYHKARGL